MVKSSGHLIGLRRFPYIYFIIKGEYLYIGETQKIPTIRWSNHLAINGSFSNNLRLRDDEMYHKNIEIQFYAYSCDTIYEITKPEERRGVTQYIEYLLHVKAICDPILGPRYSLISDTIRTAPLTCEYDWANDLSDEIIKAFKEDLANN